MNQKCVPVCLKMLLSLVLSGIVIFLLFSRISSVNADVSRQLSPTQTPGVWAINTCTIDALPWSMPPSSGMTADYYDGVRIVDIGALTLEDYDTFTSHADLPVDYLEFDRKDTVQYALLPLTLQNASDEDVLVQFADFWLFCGIAPGSYAQSLMPQFNEKASSVIAPNDQVSFTVVYRILRSGFSSDTDWANISSLNFELVIMAYPDKFIYNLTLA